MAKSTARRDTAIDDQQEQGKPAQQTGCPSDIRTNIQGANISEIKITSISDENAMLQLIERQNEPSRSFNIQEVKEPVAK